MIIVLLFLSTDSFAVCKGKFFNPITDIDWWGIFPVKIGGITVFKSKISTPPTPGGCPICVCGKFPNIKIGIKVSFWDPARLIETVKDAWCFPSIGVSLETSGFLNGSTTSKEDSSNELFAQAHYIWMDVFSLVGMFIDYSCLSPTDFDIAYMTEIDPLWNSDLTAFLLNPEALLFANPITQIACAADSIASTLNYPLDPLFWCVGSWGSAYPLTGHYSGRNLSAGNALIAARMLYKLSRELLLWDGAVSYCYKYPTPIWIKSHYRLQEARPVRSSSVIQLGKSDLLWGEGSNPPIGAKGSEDNFLWVLFKERLCCMGIGF